MAKKKLWEKRGKDKSQCNITAKLLMAANGKDNDMPARRKHADSDK